MYRTIQVGNLGYSMDDRDLARLFTPHGSVHSARVSTHSSSGRSTGVGFVQMEFEQDGETAIAALNGRTHCGRVLSVCWSKPWTHQEPIAGDMFGPMNMADSILPPQKPSERRGLPEEH